MQNRKPNVLSRGAFGLRSIAPHAFLFCAALLVLTFLLFTQTFAYDTEAITVTPTQGPTGRLVTVTGTGWQDLGSRGIDVPIWIGFANQVADAHPDANGNFSVSFTIPINLPGPPDYVNGKLTVSAIIGNGGSADAIYTVDVAQSPGWYSGGPTTIYTDNSGLAIIWENSSTPRA